MQRTGLTWIGYWWVILSGLSSLCLLSGFYVPHWIIGQISLNGRFYTVYLSAFRRCNFPVFDQELLQFRIVNECGTYEDLAHIPSIYWQFSMLTMACASFLSLLLMFILIPACCLDNILNKQTAVLIGLVQVMSAVSISVGCILFPMGWDTQEVRDSCGTNADKFLLGDCELGWAYIILLVGAGLMLVCGALSVCGARSFRQKSWYNNQDAILQPCRQLKRDSFDAQALINNNLFIEDRPVGSVHSHLVRHSRQMVLLLLCSTVNGLECYFCRHSLRNKDVSEQIDQNPECMSFEMFSLQNFSRRGCSSREAYCVSRVVNLNGYFLEVARDCDENCKPMCTETGYGLGYTECTRCCTSDLCNNFDGRDYFLPNMVSSLVCGVTVIWVLLILNL
ncbi:unnamed protein product [Bursaphelenchus okinawaensis]|uniref:Uncharacterized protein n=1 Tax=Bursaphelenchus okinawaensis TaxID=465554 RepID=A0A811LKY1_9BILA|nr:unnamed protein product [Bursaphelenchus okinawaensis]CAG9125248.1 unnamed protein product [Bursaphelenchus okinawaensis]